MASREEGEKAIEELNGKEFAGRELKVNEAKPRENRSFGGGGGGGGNRGGGGGNWNSGGYGGGRNGNNRW
jgi:RNA recognition motif-containing protein